MRMILGTAAALAAGLLAAAPPANAAEDTRPCVSAGEFGRLPVGLTRREVESRWEVAGLATWDPDRSDPGHDAYTYPACGTHRADITVRVTYARHTRIWTVRVWNRAY